MYDRRPCCTDAGSRCGTQWDALVAFVARTTGKGVRVVALQGDEQGKAPFFAQPVGFDGRAFFVARDHGCDTEKLLHEACHWLVAPKARRSLQNYGLGPNPTKRVVGEEEADNEEVTVMLVERLLAPRFGLPLSKIAKPDYNTYRKSNVDWDACEARAEALVAGLSAGGAVAPAP